MRIYKQPKEFEWDKGNIGKNEKHKVKDQECEEVFFDADKKIFKDRLHSKDVERFRIIGKTKKGRLLFVVFTIRNSKIRIISARDINKRRCNYMKKKLNLPKFKNEDEERKFWAKIDLSEYYEPNDLEPVSFPNLKPTTRSISIRIPEYLLVRVKEKANETNIPYQSLIKEYIKRGIFSSR